MMQPAALLKAMVACALLAIAAGATPVHARIVCDGPYQVVGGSTISTPYCQDSYVAQVARSYGIRVSAAEIRNNPTTKARVCRIIGHDNRVQTACAGFRDDFRRRGF